MALALTHRRSLQLILGYESGHAAVYTLSLLPTPTATVTYLSRPHSQPVLSLAAAPSLSRFYTTSADAVVAAHPLPSHSPSASTSADSASTTTAAPALSSPLKTRNTAHAGQQSVAVRSDARIVATAGWDARVRVYGARSLRELAVLKWHRQGVYAVDFADVGPPPEEGGGELQVVPGEGSGGGGGVGEDRDAGIVTRKGNGELKEWEGAAERRERIATTTHWLAAGAKDGNVSLWEIY